MAVNPKERKIGLSDGHGDFGVTAGKRTPVFPETSPYAGSFMYENAFNKIVVAELNIILKHIGFQTILLAPTDADTPLSTRVATANSNNVDLYISVHANANTGSWGTWGGIETFAMPSGEGNKLAKIIHKHMIQGTPLRDRGVKGGSHLYEIKNPKAPAVLVECAFMDNLKEAELLMSYAYRKECAREIAKGICEYYGVAYSEPNLVAKEEIKGTLVVQKERVYASGGKLVTVPLNTGKPYSTKATDVRFIKVPASRVKKVKFVYAKGKKVSDIAKTHGADLAFNFPFFYGGVPLGDTEDNDKIISSANGKMLKWKEFAFADGKFQIGDLDKKDKQDFLVQATPLLTLNGVTTYVDSVRDDLTQDDIAKSRCQRTFVGTDEHGDLLLAVCDGRTTSDQGMNLEEMALFMLSKGMKNSINGDGGGSSTLCLNGSVLNSNKSNERVVNHAILIWFNDEIKEPDKGSDVEVPTIYVTGTIDVKENAWYASSVKYAMEKGHLSVNEKGELRPNDPITRAEFASWLHRNKKLFEVN